MSETITDLEIEHLLSKLHTGGSVQEKTYPKGFYQTRAMIENIFGKDDRGQKTMGKFRDFLREVLKS